MARWAHALRTIPTLCGQCRGEAHAGKLQQVDPAGRVAFVSGRGRLDQRLPNRRRAGKSYLRLAQTVERFSIARDWIESLIGGESAAARVLAVNHGRMQSIERSFISTGLAGQEPLVVFERLHTLGDAQLQDELSAIVRELSWRLRELERDTLLRASALPSEDARLVYEMVDRLRPDKSD